jgi:hypothetical protein
MTDLPPARLVAIFSWVALGVFAFAALLVLLRDDGSSFDERLVTMLPMIGQGVFYCGVLQGVALWMDRNAG